MDEQRPGSWVGQEVTVYYGPEGRQHTGLLEAVTPDGIIVSSLSGEEEEQTAFYPLGSVHRLLHGKPKAPQATVDSF